MLQSLDAHGRDWKAAAAYVGTRDVRAYTSHAQKHFIKLCLAGKPVPPKVAETGRGYTLSGKPLDPHSAAAKAYGFKPDSLASRLHGRLPPVWMTICRMGGIASDSFVFGDSDTLMHMACILVIFLHGNNPQTNARAWRQ